MFVVCLSLEDNHSVLSSIILISVNEKNAPCFHFVKILIPKCRIHGNAVLKLKKIPFGFAGTIDKKVYFHPRIQLFCQVKLPEQNMANDCQMFYYIYAY